MTYSQVKRKKASQLAVMLATPSHAIESVHGAVMGRSAIASHLQLSAPYAYAYKVHI